MSDTNDAVLRFSHSDAAYGIIARKRVWAINDGRLPTVEDYHAALVQCLKDKAGEIERLRLTDAEREAVERAAGCYVAECDELQAAGVVVDAKRLAVRDTLRGLLNRMTL